jgi:hypothetical protein
MITTGVSFMSPGSIGLGADAVATPATSMVPTTTTAPGKYVPGNGVRVDPW